MSEREKNLWQGLDPAAQQLLKNRDYTAVSLEQRLSHGGVEAGELSVGKSKRDVSQDWIPGVEIFSRTIHPQPFRGTFGEFARRDEGMLAKIGFWPVQWSAARMFPKTAKGFHIH